MVMCRLIEVIRHRPTTSQPDAPQALPAPTAPARYQVPSQSVATYFPPQNTL